MPENSQPQIESDPRVYFAAERTLLAWMRTGLAVVGVGFLVARFGLFLRMLRHPAQDVSPPLGSSLIGIGFVLLGSFMIAAAAWQHTRFSKEIKPADRPANYFTGLAVGMAGLMAALSLALTVYLVVSLWVSGVQVSVTP
jgi:putative membrane protein